MGEYPYELTSTRELLDLAVEVYDECTWVLTAEEAVRSARSLLKEVGSFAYQWDLESAVERLLGTIS